MKSACSPDMAHVPQEDVEALLLTQPVGLLNLMARMAGHLRADVRQLFPGLTLAEHLAVCDMVAIMMQESIEKARLDRGGTCDETHEFQERPRCPDSAL